MIIYQINQKNRKNKIMIIYLNYKNNQIKRKKTQYLIKDYINLRY